MNPFSIITQERRAYLLVRSIDKVLNGPLAPFYQLAKIMQDYAAWRLVEVSHTRDSDDSDEYVFRFQRKCWRITAWLNKRGYLGN